MNAPLATRLRSPAPGLWTADHDLLMPGGLNFGTRTTALRLPSGGLLLHAPGPLDAALKAELDALGRVEALLAPNLFHHLALKDHAAAFPGARILAPPGLREKIPGLPEHETAAPEGDFGPDIPWRMVRGMPQLNELAVLHRPSGTVLLADLCFHFVDHPQWLLRTGMRLMGSYGVLRPSLYGKRLMKDRAAVRASLDTVLSWDFSRVSVCHGRVVEADGHARLEEAFAFLR